MAAQPSASLVKPLVFGGLDGLTTTLALVWGSMGAGEQLVSASAVLVLGVANLLATAVSMGIGDYVGSLAEHEAATHHSNNTGSTGGVVGGSSSPEPSASLTRASSTATVGGSAAHHGAARAREVKAAALRSGLTMFGSFIGFGGLPLLVYTPIVPIGIESRRVVATALCFLSFLLLGAARARLTGGRAVSTAVNMAALGTAAAVVSYGASRVIYTLVVGHDAPAVAP